MLPESTTDTIHAGAPSRETIALPRHGAGCGTHTLGESEGDSTGRWLHVTPDALTGPATGGGYQDNARQMVHRDTLGADYDRLASATRSVLYHAAKRKDPHTCVLR